MSILSFSDFLNISEDMSKPTVDRDIARERDELMNQVVELVGLGSQSGLTIQIGDINTNLDKVIVKVLINGIDNNIELENGQMKITSTNGGLLDGVKGDPNKVINVLQGIKDGNLAEI